MDYFLIAYGALLLALSFFFGKYGSLWIDRLYLKNHSILSFPDAVGSRARYRVKLLTLLFFLTGIRLFFVSQGNYFSSVTCTLRIAAFDHCNRF